MRLLKITGGCLTVTAISLFVLSFEGNKNESHTNILSVDFSKIPKDKFGDEVKYGKELMTNTAYYIGPDGTNGRYLGNKMNCSSCHQDAGTKAFSFNLISSHENYPQYRPREGRVLTLAERVNNCIERPHNGKPLPLDSREMIAILSYLKWINGFAPKNTAFAGSKNLQITFPQREANSEIGSRLYTLNCQRCHGANGEGQLNVDKSGFVYPPLWGDNSYQPGSSMHRIIKMAQWLKANMPYDKASWDKPFLSDEDALDVAAFVNDDALHKRPHVNNFDYPRSEEKAIDYAIGPFSDTFSVKQHRLGPYLPIINYWKEKGLRPVY